MEKGSNKKVQYETSNGHINPDLIIKPQEADYIVNTFPCKIYHIVHKNHSHTQENKSIGKAIILEFN